MLALLPHWTTFDTMLVLCANIAGLGLLIVLVARQAQRRDQAIQELLQRVADEWRFQHAQGTYVGTLRGLWTVLEDGLERGGLPADFRRRIYRAGDECFERFFEATGVTSREDHRPILFDVSREA